MNDSQSPLLLYPVAEKAPERVRTGSGKPLSTLTLEGVMDGTITPADITITPGALRLQADIARAAGRETLAENFERAAELVAVPQEMLIDTYEMLRPGRTENADALRARAAELRNGYGAENIASMLEEAATVYERRGLFEKRY